MPTEYRFEPVSRDDYPMLRNWLAEPQVAAVWGTPDDEIALIEQEVDGGDCAMHIVWADRPFAFVQDWCPHLAGVPHLVETPAGTRAVDTFLGDRAYLGQHRAQAYMRRYAETLIAGGVPLVVTDPHVSNERGIAMYRGAGFAEIRTDRNETGDPVAVMEYRPT